jgi:hypothetical protein
LDREEIRESLQSLGNLGVLDRNGSFPLFSPQDESDARRTGAFDPPDFRDAD